MVVAWFVIGVPVLIIGCAEGFGFFPPVPIRFVLVGREWLLRLSDVKKSIRCCIIVFAHCSNC